jgi:AraC-like DNA-binding protein
MRKGEPTVAVNYVRLLADYAGWHGLPAAALLQEAGLPAGALDDVDARLLFRDFDRMMEHAADKLGDPNLGLHLGQEMRIGHLGAYGLMMVSCSTIAELVPRMVRYAALMHEACRDEIEEARDAWILHWRSNLPGNAAPGRQHVEHNFASIVAIRGWATGKEVVPLWVSFRHPRPEDAGEQEAFFGCPLRFDAPENSIAWPAWFLETPLLQANLPVRQAMESLSEQQLKKLGARGEPEWLAVCRNAIADAFGKGAPELEPIAAAAGLPGWKLRRLLAEHDLNFRELVDEVRRDLAKRYVADPTLSLIDVAFLLGFSEQSAFQRAFRRWTGEAPGRVRRSLRAGGGT